MTNYQLKTKLRELVLPAYLSGQIDFDSAVARLNVSSRHFYRILNKYKSNPDLTHLLCKKPSNRSIKDDIKHKVIELYKTKYRGWNYQHLEDAFSWWEDISISADTIRNILLNAKLVLPKKRKPRKYMQREPKPQFNQMLQIDGTFGDFLGTGQELCLMHLVDDATRTSLAMLGGYEGTKPALELLYQWCLTYGIPQSIYSDRHTTYKAPYCKLTLEEELEGREMRLSEFGKVCEKLGIKQIFASSAPAKGRIERKHQLYKDRYIKELKLLGISSIEDANSYLIQHDGFIDRINRRFTIKPREASTASVLPTAAELAEQFAIENDRIVRNDYTVQFKNTVYQLPRNTIVNAKSRVTIKQYMDNTIAIFAGNNKLEFKLINNYIASVANIQKKADMLPTHAKKKDLKEHPFRQNYKPEKKYQLPSSTARLEFIAKQFD